MRHYTILIGVLCMLFIGCKDDGADDGTTGGNDHNGETVLECSIDKLTLDNDGNTKKFSIMSNAEWTISNNSAWCKTDRTGGKGNAVVSVMAFPYEEYDDRSTNLTIKAGTTTKVLAVTQKKKDALLLTTEKYTVGQEGATIAVEVKSNVDYSITIPYLYKDWIKEVKGTATKALVTRTKHFEIASNPNGSKRDGIIVFKDNSSSLSDTVHVYQVQEGNLLLIENQRTIDASARTLQVELQTNVEYEVIVPDSVAAWISVVSRETAEKADRILLDIQANETGVDRIGRVIFADQNGIVSDTLTIRQMYERALYIVGEKKHSLNYFSQTLPIELHASVEYEIIIPDSIASWISVASRETVEKTNRIQLDIQANGTGKDRVGKVIFANKNSIFSDTLTIEQYRMNLFRFYKSISLSGLETSEYISKLMSTEIDGLEYEFCIPGEIEWQEGNRNSHFRIEKNLTGKHREKLLLARQKGSSLVDTLKIHQCICSYDKIKLEETNGQISYLEWQNDQAWGMNNEMHADISSNVSKIRIPYYSGIHYTEIEGNGGDWILGTEDIEIVATNKGYHWWRIACDTCPWDFQFTLELTKVTPTPPEETIKDTTEYYLDGLANEYYLPNDSLGLEHKDKYEFITDVPWISFVSSMMLMRVESNNTEYEREAIVIIKDKETKAIRIWKIRQKSYPLISLTSVEEIKEFIARGYNEISGSLTIEINDPDFTDLSVFANHQIKKINHLYIQCPYLQSFQGMAGLEEVNELRLYNTTSLRSFSGLETLTSLNALYLGYIVSGTEFFKNFTTFQGLNGIKTLKKLNLRGEFPALRSFEGLENLTTIGISLNGRFDALTSFKGLKNIKTTYDFQLLGTFPVLASFEGLENLTAINGSFCLSQGYRFDGTFDKLTDFRGLGKVEYIGSFIISNYPKLPALQSFNGFYSLKEIGKRLSLDFFNLPSCFSLNGLNHLTTVGGDVYIEKGEFTSLQGLNSLKTVGGTVTIYHCTKLLSIDGLNGLQAFPNAQNGAKVLKIDFCPKLKNFCALSDDFLRHYDLEVTDCVYNPTRLNLLNGDCSL